MQPPCSCSCPLQPLQCSAVQCCPWLLQPLRCSTRPRQLLSHRCSAVPAPSSIPQPPVAVVQHLPWPQSAALQPLSAQRLLHAAPAAAPAPSSRYSAVQCSAALGSCSPCGAALTLGSCPWLSHPCRAAPAAPQLLLGFPPLQQQQGSRLAAALGSCSRCGAALALGSRSHTTAGQSLPQAASLSLLLLWCSTCLAAALARPAAAAQHQPRRSSWLSRPLQCSRPAAALGSSSCCSAAPATSSCPAGAALALGSCSRLSHPCSAAPAAPQLPLSFLPLQQQHPLQAAALQLPSAPLLQRCNTGHEQLPAAAPPLPSRYSAAPAASSRPAAALALF